MATIQFRVASGLQWLQTIIRPTSNGVETELQFEQCGRPFSILIDALPPEEFLRRVMEADCLTINEISGAERDWIEDGRYKIAVNDDDEISNASVCGHNVRWTSISDADRKQ
jgi:hypothetical protein